MNCLIEVATGIDLYQAIQTRWAALQPIQLRTEAELRVQV